MTITTLARIDSKEQESTCASEELIVVRKLRDDGGSNQSVSGEEVRSGQTLYSC